MMDFDAFSKSVERVYKGGPYTIQDVLYVFNEYFNTYQEETGLNHPPLRREQIRRIIEIMPYLTAESAKLGTVDIEADEYPQIIAQHFATNYRAGCDYNINHFFSGAVRFMRYREILNGRGV